MEEGWISFVKEKRLDSYGWIRETWNGGQAGRHRARERIQKGPSKIRGHLRDYMEN